MCHLCRLASREIQSRGSSWVHTSWAFFTLSHTLPLHNSHINTGYLIAKLQANLARNKANTWLNKFNLTYTINQVMQKFNPKIDANFKILDKHLNWNSVEIDPVCNSHQLRLLNKGFVFFFFFKLLIVAHRFELYRYCSYILSICVIEWK